MHVCVGIVLIALLACASVARSESRITQDDVDAQVRPLVEQGWLKGVVVGVIDEDGRRTFGYGLTADGGSRPDGRTIFEIGSVTKVFTTSLLAQMAAAGEVALDDPVSKHLPPGVTIGEKGRPITLADLATHTSGLPRLPANMRPADMTNPYSDYSVDQLHDALHPVREPGTYEYSNLAMGLLGHALATRGGASYEDVLAERICAPLGMVDTRITLSDEQRQRLAAGHDADLNPQPNWDLPTLAGAGALRSTADDLLAFLAAHMGLGDTPLREALATTHAERVRASDGRGIALGWHVDRRRGVLYHGGQTGAYHAFVGFDPQRKVGVVVLSNTASGRPDFIGLNLLERAQGETMDPPELPEPADADPALLADAPGHYIIFIPPDLDIGIVGGLVPVTIGRDDDHLTIQLLGQPRFGLYATTEGRFYLKVVEARVEFERDPKAGKVVALWLEQNGRRFRGPRTDQPK